MDVSGGGTRLRGTGRDSGVRVVSLVVERLRPDHDPARDIKRIRIWAMVIAAK